MANTQHGMPGIYKSAGMNLSDGQGSALATDSKGQLLLSGASGFTSYSAKTFTIGGAQTNYNVKTAQSLFASTASSVTLKTDIACTIKINAATNDGIALDAGEEIVISGFLAGISNIFITTTADTAIRIIINV